MSQQDDQYYIELIVNRDSSAFTILVDRHKLNIYNIALKILKNREEAEEAAQDTFIKAFEKIKTFKGDAKFSTWLYRIAYNTAISYHRKKKSEAIPMDEFFIANHTEDDIVELLHSENVQERELKLKRAIQQLDGQEQLVLELYYDKEMSTIEIETITDLSQSNVKVKLHRARQRLFQLMQPQLKNNAKIA